MIMGAAIASSRGKKQAAAQAAATPAPAPADTNSTTDIEKLKQLAELKDQGILTQDEFDAKKKEILGL
jgi:membrane protease subunit (stomatin/prohibitin family)